MPRNTTLPFQRSGPAAIKSIDHGTSAAICHTSYGQLQVMLRDVLLDVVGSAHRMHGIGRVGCGACAGLYALLTAHPVDGRGRCWSCRRPGWLGRRRRCASFT
ncbi:MAG TPA: hypothetical protein VIY28_10985 [Pseudonocardiaceae bacterium]